MAHEAALDDSLHTFQVDCHEVVFFWRLKRMIDITSNALRQQISNIEGSYSVDPIGSSHSCLALARRLEREVKEILDDFSSDESLKETLLKGKRVNIAEELSKTLLVRHAQPSSFVVFRTRPAHSRETRRIHRSTEQGKISLSLVNSLDDDEHVE